MKVGLKTTVMQVPKKAIEGVNELGASTRGLLKNVGKVAQEGTDKFALTKVGQGLKKAGVNKDTAIGLALIAVAISNVVRIGKNIKARVDESKQTLKQ